MPKIPRGYAPWKDDMRCVILILTMPNLSINHLTINH